MVMVKEHSGTNCPERSDLVIIVLVIMVLVIMVLVATELVVASRAVIWVDTSATSWH